MFHLATRWFRIKAITVAVLAREVTGADVLQHQLGQRCKQLTACHTGTLCVAFNEPTSWYCHASLALVQKTGLFLVAVDDQGLPPYSRPSKPRFWNSWGARHAISIHFPSEHIDSNRLTCAISFGSSLKFCAPFSVFSWMAHKSGGCNGIRNGVLSMLLHEWQTASL